MSNIIIRKGTPQDVPAAHALIVELAEYEKAAHHVTTTPESMLKDGFGDDPLFQFFVSEENGEVTGLALYYFRYSTWVGRCLYLEDLVVKENQRGKGIGKKLIDALVTEARESKCQRVLWEVLNWNEPAINFYKSLDATFDDEWINCKLLEHQIYPERK